MAELFSDESANATVILSLDLLLLLYQDKSKKVVNSQISQKKSLQPFHKILKQVQDDPLFFSGSVRLLALKLQRRQARRRNQIHEQSSHKRRALERE